MIFGLDADALMIGLAIGIAAGAQGVIYFFHLVVKCDNCCQLKKDDQ